MSLTLVSGSLRIKPAVPWYSGPLPCSRLPSRCISGICPAWLRPLPGWFHRRWAAWTLASCCRTSSLPASSLPLPASFWKPLTEVFKRSFFEFFLLHFENLLEYEVRLCTVNDWRALARPSDKPPDELFWPIPEICKPFGLQMRTAEFYGIALCLWSQTSDSWKTAALNGSITRKLGRQIIR